MSMLLLKSVNGVYLIHEKIAGMKILYVFA